jgi:hypothetical protein
VGECDGRADAFADEGEGGQRTRTFAKPPSQALADGTVPGDGSVSVLPMSPIISSLWKTREKGRAVLFSSRYSTEQPTHGSHKAKDEPQTRGPGNPEDPECWRREVEAMKYLVVPGEIRSVHSKSKKQTKKQKQKKLPGPPSGASMGAYNGPLVVCSSARRTFTTKYSSQVPRGWNPGKQSLTPAAP